MARSGGGGPARGWREAGTTRGGSRRRRRPGQGMARGGGGGPAAREAVGGCADGWGSATEMRFLLRLFIVAEDVGQQEPRPWHSWEGMRRLAMSRNARAAAAAAHLQRQRPSSQA